jgi:hypothetical protein
VEFKQNPYIVYVKVNSNGYIIAVNSSAFLPDTTGWVEIDSGHGDKYGHAQSNYFPEPIYTMGGAYRYKLVDGKSVECTPEEIAAQEEANKPKTIAPRNILTGEYVTVTGVLYKAIENIPVGEHIVTGQNAVETTIEEQLYELKGE